MLAFSKSSPLIQNAEDFALGVSNLAAWSAKMQAAKLGKMSTGITPIGHILHLKDEIAKTFGFSMVSDTPTLVTPSEIRQWFKLVPWRAGVYAHNRFFLTTQLMNSKFSISLPCNEIIAKRLKLEGIPMMYFLAGDALIINELLAVHFSNKPIFSDTEAYHACF
jgi:hypothetical protein